MKKEASLLLIALSFSACAMPWAPARLPGLETDAPATSGIRRSQDSDGDDELYHGVETYKQNYFALFANNFSENDRGVFGPIDDFEWVFQLSLRHDVYSYGKEKDFRVTFAYTGRSFWQIAETSSPIRTTDHEPELFAEFRTDHDPLGKIWPASKGGVLYRVGINHQSNGEGGLASRGWNRATAEMVLHSHGWFDTHHVPEHDEWSGQLSIKPWAILSKSGNNRDIEKYIGYGEITGDYAFGFEWWGFEWRPKASFRLRHNLRTSGGRGGLELALSGQLGTWQGLRWYAQYFNGYGENLLDYDDSSNRVSVGVEFGRMR